MKGFAVIWIIGGLVVAIVVIYAACLMWVFPQLHNQTLDKFSSQLLTIPVPQKTQLIDTLSEVGQQSGNSDHCDYLGALLLKTDLSKSDAEKYYRDNYKGSSQLHFYWTNEPHQPGIGAVNPTNIFTLDSWVNDKSKITGANLIVYIFEGAMTSAFDYRCS